MAGSGPPRQSFRHRVRATRGHPGSGGGAHRVINGARNVAIASRGPGTGNGVVGGAATFVLGLVALALGRLALARCRRIALQSGRIA